MRIAAIVIVACAVVLSIASCSRSVDPTSGENALPTAGESALPTAQEGLLEAAFTDADGKTVRLSDYRGKQSVVLLFMRGFSGEFACYYCGLQTKEYKTRYEDLKSAGAEVLVILPGTTDAQAYLEKVGTADEDEPDPKFQVPYPILLDTDYSACRVFNVAFDPTFNGAFPVDEPATIVIGKDGMVLYEYHGKNPSDRAKIEDVLEVVKTGKAKKAGSQGDEKAVVTLAWVSYEDGLKRAKEERKPLLLDFYADW